MLSCCSLPLAKVVAASCQGNQSHALALSLGADGEGVTFVVLQEEEGDTVLCEEGTFLDHNHLQKSYSRSEAQGRQQGRQLLS